MGSENTQPPPVGVPETNQAGFSTTVTDTTLSEALIMLRKRRWVLIICVLLGLAYGIFRAVSQPKLYEAYGRIQVRSGSSNEYRVSAVQGYGGDAGSKMLTEVAILKSDSLMLTVCREMDLANNAIFLNGRGRSRTRAWMIGVTRQRYGSPAAEQPAHYAGSEDGHYPDQLRQPESEAVGGHRQQGHPGLHPTQLRDAI